MNSHIFAQNARVYTAILRIKSYL